MEIQWPLGSLTAITRTVAGDAIISMPGGYPGIINWGISVRQDLGLHLTANWVIGITRQYTRLLLQYETALFHRTEVLAMARSGMVPMRILDGQVLDARMALVAHYARTLEQFNALLIQEYVAAGGEELLCMESLA
jgi:hypothetical protein